MKSSLWILNSALTLLVIGISGLLLISRPQRPPRKVLLTPSIDRSVLQQEVVKIDLASIYEKDPFGTISTPQETKPQPMKPLIEPVPLPPVERRIAMPSAHQPQFLPPLAITLKGVIFSDYEHDNRAIIADSKTKQEALYKVGDSLIDSEIIRIESNKIMVMRSNGQQETIFVSSLDAHNDPMYQQIEGIKGLPTTPVRAQGPHNFLIDPELIKKTVSNLAHFIEILDITTEFEKGRGVGCRIGAIQPGSLGTLLGLQRNDVITTINDIPTGTAADRLAIYEQISKMKSDDTIKIQVSRNEHTFQLTYTIASFSARKKTTPPPPQQRPSRQTQSQPYPVQQQFSTIPSLAQQQPLQPIPQQPLPQQPPLQQPLLQQPLLLPPGATNAPQAVPQSNSIPPNTQLSAREIQLQNLDKRVMFENGGRSGMLRPSQP